MAKRKARKALCWKRHGEKKSEQFWDAEVPLCDPQQPVKKGEQAPMLSLSVAEAWDPYSGGEAEVRGWSYAVEGYGPFGENLLFAAAQYFATKNEAQRHACLAAQRVLEDAQDAVRGLLKRTVEEDRS